MKNSRCKIGKTTRRVIFLLGFWVLACLSPARAAADLNLRSYVDRNTVGVGEQFTLSVELSGPAADRVTEPDLPDLSSFARYLGSGTSQSIQFINGKVSSTRTINYYYRAIQKGRFEIGPVVVEEGGEIYETDPIRMEITDPGKAPAPSSGLYTGSSELTAEDLFLRVEASRTEVYPNQPLLLTYKIYTRVNVSQYSVITEPDTAGFWVEDLLADQQQVETTNEIIGGQRYTAATIRKQLMFPTRPRTLRIEPMEIECQVRVQSRRRRSIFDDFLSDPFSSDFFGRSVAYMIASDPVEIEVLPFPSEGKPAEFNGLVGNFELRAKIDKNQVETNEVATYTLTVSGKGNFQNLAAPTLDLSAGIESYEPEVTEKIRPGADGFSGQKIFRYPLVPRTAGTKQIAGIRLAFFDPDKRGYRVVSTPATELRVTAGDHPPVFSQPALSKQEVRLLSQEIRFIKLNPPAFRDPQRSRFGRITVWGILLAPILALGAAFLYRRHTDRLQGDEAYARRRSAAKSARKRLREAHAALDSGDDEAFFSRCGKALRGFVADQLNLSESAVIGEGVESILSRQNLPQATIREFVECLETAAAKLYSPLQSTPEEKEEFYRKAEAVLEQLNRELSK